MAVWNYQRIQAACIVEQLVTPFDASCVNPASIDLRLGESYRLPAKLQWGDEQHMDASGYELQPGQFILCCSLETVAIPNNAIAFLYSKSSTGRKGLEHLHAGLGDPGFRGQWTFEFHNVAPWPIQLVPGQRIMQMVVEYLTDTTLHSYAETGRYQNQTGATPAREAR